MSADGDRFDKVLADYLQRLDSGEPAPLQELIDAHPELADELRSYFEMADLVDEAIVRGETHPPGGDSTLTPAAPPSPPGYQVLEEIGRGGMGIVHRAIRISTQSEVALKVLPPGSGRDPQRLARFRQEAAAASQLTASHVLPVFDVIDHQGTPVIVMPYIDGAHLGRILRERRELPQSDFHPWARLGEQEYVQSVLGVADQIVEAVAAIHKARVVHRDIKPSNILIDREGNAWLCDFGLARFAEADGLTMTGDMLGTRGYMSPEQAIGSGDVDGRADLFSLGVTIYEALTGELPYGRRVLTEASPPPLPLNRRQRLISQDYESVIFKTIEFDRQERYATVLEFQADWRRVRQGLLPRARRVGRARRAVRWLRRNRWLAATAALCAVVVALGWQLLPAAPDLYEVQLPTSPAGARAVLVPIDPDSGELRPDLAIRSSRQVQGAAVFDNVAPGDYWVEAEVQGHGFHEFFRRVPNLARNEVRAAFQHQYWEVVGRTIRLHEVAIPAEAVTNGMTLYEGNFQFPVGIADATLHALTPYNVTIDQFFVDPTEASVEACLAVTAPHLAPSETARSALNLPMTGISFDQAVEYAERMGKRLPTEFEFEYAATGKGTTTFPWGNDPTMATPSSFGRGIRAAHDVTSTTPPVRQLYSGVVEWTSSWGLPYPSSWGLPILALFRSLPDYRQLRTVRGGPIMAASIEDVGQVPEFMPDLKWGPRFRGSIYRSQTFPNLGFRCVRSVRPRFIPPQN